MVTVDQDHEDRFVFWSLSPIPRCPSPGPLRLYRPHSLTGSVTLHLRDSLRYSRCTVRYPDQSELAGGRGGKVECTGLRVKVREPFASRWFSSSCRPDSGRVVRNLGRV